MNNGIEDKTKYLGLQKKNLLRESYESIWYRLVEGANP